MRKNIVATLFMVVAIALPALAQLPANAESIVGEIADEIRKSKTKGVRRGPPEIILLSSLLEKELADALASRAEHYQMSRQACAEKFIQDLKLPPKEYLHYAVAAWMARKCDAQLAVIAGSETAEKPNRVFLNAALVRSRDSKILESWTAEIPPEAVARSPASPAASATLQVASSAPPTEDAPRRAGRDGVGLPQCVYCPNPSFTKEASNVRGYFGRVLLRVVVTREGSVGEVQLSEGAAFGLNEQAMNAVQKWQLKPAADAEGNPVPTWTTIEVTFHNCDPVNGKLEGVPACEFCPNPRAADCTPAKVASPVVLRVLVTADGRAQQISVVKGIDPCLNQKAVEAVRTWKFRRIPMAVWTTIEINFREYK